MAHTHSVIDSDNHFSIDPVTRTITNESEKKKLIQFDHNSERFTFEIPRYVDGHDMSLCDVVRVHYINLSKTKIERNTGAYSVDDMKVVDDIVEFSWLISRNATNLVGTLTFLVQFACSREDGIFDYEWHTDVYSKIIISAGMNNEEVIEEEYPDILEQWKNEIISKIPPQTVKRIESLDFDNMINLRDIDSGSYILYGKFKPYSGSDSTMTFGSNLIVNILKDSSNSQVQVFYPNDNCVQYLKITDDSYERTNVYLNNLATVAYVDESIGTKDDALDLLLETEIVKPIISNDNSLYTDNEGTIFVL